jgi:hypothetical protein
MVHTEPSMFAGHDIPCLYHCKGKAAGPKKTATRRYKGKSTDP